MKAEEYFKTAYQKQQAPEEAMVLTIAKSEGLENGQILIETLFSSGKYKSKSDIRRLIMQGGVKINGEKVSDLKIVPTLDSSSTIQIGKGTFFKLA